MIPKNVLRQRLLNKRLDAPVYPGADVTRRDVAHERKAAEALKFGPAEQLLAQRQTQQPHWFDQYQQAIRDAEGRQQAAQAATAQQIQGFGNSGVQASNSLRDQLLQSMGQNAAVTGAQVDPGVAERANQASLVRQALTNSFGAQLANQGQAEGDFLRARGIGAEQAGVQANQDLAKALADLTQQKSAYGEQVSQDVIDAARKRQLENVAFNLKDKTVEQQAAAGRAQRREQRRHNQVAEQQAGERIQVQRERAQKTAAGKPVKWQTPTEQQDFWKNVAKTNGVAQGLYDEGEKDDQGKVVHPPYKSRAELIARLRQDPKYPGDLAAAVALDHIFGTGLTNATIRNLRKNRIKVQTGGRWGKRAQTSSSTHGN